MPRSVLGACFHDGVLSVKSRLGQGVGPLQERPHVSNPVGRLGIRIAYQNGAVVEDHNSVKVHLPQSFHDLPHIVIPVIHKGLDKMRQRRTDIAEMNFPNLIGAEVADHLLRILARELAAAFEPRSTAKANPHVGTMGNFKSSFVAFKVAENTPRNARERRHRRIVRMDADPYALLFSYRSHPLDEIRVVFPNLLWREYPAVREWLVKELSDPRPLLVRARHIEFSCGRPPDFRSTAAPDAVAHVSIRRVVDSGLPPVSEIVLVLFNFLIPAREIQGDFRHVMNVGVPDVPNRDAGIRITLLNLEEAFGGAQIRC